MFMTLIRSRLQGRELKPFICARSFAIRRFFHLRFMNSMNHTSAYSRDDRKITFRMVSAQHVINETPGV